MGDKDLISQQEARDAVDAAYLAFKAVAKFDQAKIDRICQAMAEAGLREAARLGAMAQEETGFGKAEDKREKNRFAAEDVWNHFKKSENRRRGARSRKHHRNRQPARSCRGDYSFNQSDFDDDF